MSAGAFSADSHHIMFFRLSSCTMSAVWKPLSHLQVMPRSVLRYLRREQQMQEAHRAGASCRQIST